MAPYLKSELALPPVDRVASAFLKQDETIDAGARALSAYDEFVGLLGDRAAREELESLDREAATGSEVFQRVKSLGKILEASLLSLLFEPGDKAALARNYLVF